MRVPIAFLLFVLGLSSAFKRPSASNNPNVQRFAKRKGTLRQGHHNQHIPPNQRNAVAVNPNKPYLISPQKAKKGPRLNYRLPPSTRMSQNNSASRMNQFPTNVFVEGNPALINNSGNIPFQQHGSVPYNPPSMVPPSFDTGYVSDPRPLHWSNPSTMGPPQSFYPIQGNMINNGYPQQPYATNMQFNHSPLNPPPVTTVPRELDQQYAEFDSAIQPSNPYFQQNDQNNPNFTNIPSPMNPNAPMALLNNDNEVGQSGWEQGQPSEDEIVIPFIEPKVSTESKLWSASSPPPPPIATRSIFNAASFPSKDADIKKKSKSKAKQDNHTDVSSLQSSEFEEIHDIRVNKRGAKSQHEEQGDRTDSPPIAINTSKKKKKHHKNKDDQASSTDGEGLSKEKVHLSKHREKGDSKTKAKESKNKSPKKDKKSKKNRKKRDKV